MRRTASAQRPSNAALLRAWKAAMRDEIERVGVDKFDDQVNVLMTRCYDAMKAVGEEIGPVSKGVVYMALAAIILGEIDVEKNRDEVSAFALSLYFADTLRRKRGA